MITRRGVGLLVVAIIGFFVASATRVGWLHLATALLAGTLILSAVFPQVSLLRLKATARFRPRRRVPGDLAPIAGDRVEIEIGIENRSFLPRFFVACTPAPKGSPPPGILFAHLPARVNASASMETVASVRGIQRVTQMTLECRAPFGLFRARRRCRVDDEVLVYPAWRPMRGARLLEAVQGERSGRRAARRGDEVATSRRYIVGDALRDVHWKNTARTGRPMVREFDAGVEETLTVVFETGSTLGTGAETTLEYSITLAASVGRVIIGRGGAVQFALPGRVGNPIYEWPEVMRVLAMIEPAHEVTMTEALYRVPLGSRVFAVVSGAHRAQIAALASAAQRGVGVACVVLEGFVPGDSASEGVRALARTGCAVISCARGGLRAAAAAIEGGADARIQGRANAEERVA